MTGVLVFVGIVILAIVVWLVLQWIMSPPLRGERYHDYGIIKLKEIPTYTPAHIFSLKNSTGETLTVRKVTASCGCTEVVPFDKVIPAGGIVEIPVRMKLKRSVREKADVTITFEKASPMKLQVEAAGRLVNPLIIEPRRLQMTPGQVRPVTVAMENWNDQPRSMPTFKAPDGVSIQTAPWKRVRLEDEAMGKAALDRTTLEVSVAEDAQPMESVIEVHLENQVFHVPLAVVEAKTFEPIQDDRNRNRTFNPLDRSGLKENPED